MLTLEQIENRKKGLGATDSAAVLNRSPFYTPYQLWLIKTGRIEPQAILTEDKLRLRHAHEITIANEYAFRNQVELIEPTETIFHPKFPFMFCHIDRIVAGMLKAIECKSSTAFMKQHFGENGSDEIPFHYIIQVQHQYACTGFTEIEVASLIDIDDYREFLIPRDEQIIKLIEESCCNFWNNHVLKDCPPDPTHRVDLDLIYPRSNATYIEATPTILETYEELKKIKALNKENLLIQNDFESELIKFTAENEGIMRGGKVILTYKLNQYGSRTLRLSEK